MRIFSNADLKKNTLVIDITSNSVGVAIYSHSTKSVPELIFNERIQLFQEDKTGPKKLEDDIISALNHALSVAFKSTPIFLKERGLKSEINNAIVGLSSPWFISGLHSLNINRDKSFYLDEKIIDSVIREKENLFKKELANKYSEPNEVFESALTSLYLNGYEAKTSSSTKTTSAEINFILSATKSSFKGRIEDTIWKQFGPRKDVQINSFDFIFFKVLSSSFQNVDSSLLINMSSEMMDLLYIKHGSAKLSFSIPYGPYHIIRKIKDKFDIPLGLAYSYLALYVDSLLDRNTAAEIDKIVQESTNDLKKLWEQIDPELAPKTKYLYSIFLITTTPFGKIAKALIENIIPNHNIVLVGDKNKFASELIKFSSSQKVDENLAILGSFSNLLT